MAAPPTPARRALIVEDETSIREILRLHLSLAGFETCEVADGRAALNRLRADRFDLVVRRHLCHRAHGGLGRQQAEAQDRAGPQRS